MGDYDGQTCHRNHLDFEANYITAGQNHIREPRIDPSRVSYA
jgi:hypothetical protein